MSEHEDTETKKPVKLSPVTIGITAAAVVVVAVGGFYVSKVMARAKVDTLVHQLSSPDVGQVRKAEDELEKRSAKKRLVAEVLFENLALHAGDNIEKEELFRSLFVKIGDDNTVSVLGEGLGKPETDAPTRKVAIRILAEIRKPEAASILVGLLGHEKDADDAADALVSIGKVALPSVTGAMGSKDASVRRRAVVVMGRIGDASVMPALGEAIVDDDPQVRIAAVVSVRDLAADGAVGLLCGALADAELEVRIKAIDSLEQLADASALEPLVVALSDTDSHVRAMAARILGNLGDSKAVEPLLQALSDKDPDALMKVIESLGKLDDARAVAPLIGLLSHDDAGVRRKAITALGDLGDTAAVEPILACPEAISPEAVAAYGKLGDVRATEKLVLALATEVTLRQPAIDALGLIDDPRTLELALPAIKEADCTMKIKKDLATRLMALVTGQTFVVEVPLEELLLKEPVEGEIPPEVLPE